MAWNDETGSIAPLPAQFVAAQKTMAVLGLLSTISTSCLWLQMTYRLCLWKIEESGWAKTSSRTRAGGGGGGGGGRGEQEEAEEEEVDLSLGLPEHAYRQARSVPSQEQVHMHSRAPSLATNGGRSFSTDRSNAPNPLVILIHNLILADVLLSACYLENVTWLRLDAILVSSSYCHAQAWLVSLGCLSSSMFLASMSLYTYLTIIHGYKPRGTFVVANIVVVWILSFVLTCLPPLISKTDLFGRNNLWCWISRDYYLWRLTVYIPGFGALAVASALYTLTFWGLWKDKRSARYMPPALKRSNTGATHSFSQRRQGGTRLRPSGHHPAFLVYPFVFTICAAPVTIGSIFSVSEHSTTFMAVAGAMMALTGFMDTIVWGSTILFSDEQTIKQTGLDRFDFTLTPQRQVLGNMVWIQGGTRGFEEGQQQQKPKKSGRGWRPLGGDLVSSGRRKNRVVNEADRGVHVDIVTTVVVDGESRWKGEDDGISKLPRIESLQLWDLTKRPE